MWANGAKCVKRSPNEANEKRGVTRAHSMRDARLEVTQLAYKVIRRIDCLMSHFL